MIEDHAHAAREFLAASDGEFDAGDDMQAAEKLWGAFSHAVTAVSLERGWLYGTHRKTVDAGRRLARELNNGNLEAVDEARLFHNHFYNGSMEDYEMEYGRPIVHDFVHRALGLLNSPS